MKQIKSLITEKLIQFTNGLIDQEKARVIIPANDQKKGYWFGGGNMISDELGNLWLIGRYRDHGDSSQERCQRKCSGRKKFLSSSSCG